MLHLAAALGYTRLLLTLIQWKRENPAPILHAEVDPWKSDDFGLIPLVSLFVVPPIQVVKAVQ